MENADSDLLLEKNFKGRKQFFTCMRVDFALCILLKHNNYMYYITCLSNSLMKGVCTHVSACVCVCLPMS